MDWQNLEDNELLKLIQDGNHRAFESLVRRHSTRFYRIAYRFLSNRQESEDIVQEAFIKLWEFPAMWNTNKSAKFTTWFYRVIINQCIDYRKKHKPVYLQEDTTVSDTSLISDDIISNLEQQKILEKEIHALPDSQRTALNLCFYENLSNQDAADVMKLNLKALQSLIMRAKTTLKQRMKKYL